jgi:hypothetical protein
MSMPTLKYSEINPCIIATKPLEIINLSILAKEFSAILLSGNPNIIIACG